MGGVSGLDWKETLQKQLWSLVLYITYSHETIVHITQNVLVLCVFLFFFLLVDCQMSASQFLSNKQ